MKLSLVTVTLLAAGVVFAGNKVERKVLVEFPCSIQKEGQIDVTRGLGRALSAFDVDGDGFVTNYCKVTSTSLDTDGDGTNDTLVSDASYRYESCTKIEEIEKTKEGEVVRSQIIYSRIFKNSANLSSGCQQAALAFKDLINMHLEKAAKDSDSKEAEVMNTLGDKDRVIVNK